MKLPEIIIDPSKVRDGNILYGQKLSAMKFCNDAKDCLVAGASDWRCGGDGKRGDAAFDHIVGIVLSKTGDIFVQEPDKIRKIDTLGNVTTVFGNVDVYTTRTSFCILNEQLFLFDLSSVIIVQFKSDTIIKTSLRSIKNVPLFPQHISATPFGDFLISYNGGISILSNNEGSVKITKYCKLPSISAAATKSWMCRDKSVWTLIRDCGVEKTLTLILIKNYEIVHAVKMNLIFLQIQVTDDGRVFAMDHTSSIVELGMDGIISRFHAITPNGTMAFDDNGFYYTSCSQLRKIITTTKPWKKETHYRLLSEDKLVVKSFLLLFAKKRCIVNQLPRDIVFVVLQMLEVYVL